MKKETIRMPFEEVLYPLYPEKGITIRDYFDCLDASVKGPLQTIYFEICELINELPKPEMKRAGDLLQIMNSTFILWEQIDKKALEVYRAGFEK